MSHCAATIVNACLGEMSCQGSVNQRGVSYFQKLLAFGVEPLCSYREKLCFQLTRPLMGLNMTSRVLPAMLLIGLCCLLQPSTSQADPESYADIVEKVMPSVVNISIESAGSVSKSR
jgi:S1-C subfamily serine protease